jgi:endonuclease G, mitochondrial
LVRDAGAATAFAFAAPSEEAEGIIMPRLFRSSFQPGGDVTGFRVVERLRDPGEYEDREGYDADFISAERPIALPGLGAREDDAVRFEWKGAETTVLDYTHFSTIHSESRRLPLVSAVNIDGTAEQVGIPRSDTWRYDPRIPKRLQVLRECYGDGRRGLFSRGHLTRREDPNWGSVEVATQADEDTFHATNAAPQMQRFNGNGWLQIEDYVLRNANRANMKVSVLTGPVFKRSDPVMFGVQIPVTFWKIVVFVHDVTGAVRATAYTADQAEFLGLSPAFVFGSFGNHQVAVERVAELTGLEFGVLEEMDVLAGAGRAFALKLESLEDILLE